MILHHIVEYEASRSHAEDNLVVLCSNDHARAHTKGENTRNLTPDLLRDFKRRWTDQVAALASRRILQACRGDGTWALINLRRLYELADESDVDLRSTSEFARCRKLKFVDDSGRIRSDLYDREEGFYVFDVGYEGNFLARHHEQILEAVIGETSFIDLTNKWSSGFISNSVSGSSLVVLQAAFKFKNDRKQPPSRRHGIATKKAGKIRLEVSYNAWDCTSMSAVSSHVSGHTTATILAKMRSVTKRNGHLHLKATALAIGNSFPAWKEHGFNMNDTSFDTVLPPKPKAPARKKRRRTVRI